MTLRDIERILYFEAFVVIDPGMTELEKSNFLLTNLIMMLLNSTEMNLMQKWERKLFSNAQRIRSRI